MRLDGRLRHVPKLPIVLAFFSTTFLCMPSDVFLPVRSVASALMLWPRRAVAAVAGAVRSEPTELEGLKNRVDELERTVAKLSNDIALRDRKIQELSRLGQKPSLQRWGFITASVIGTDAGQWGGMVEIDVGSREGVVQGSGVVADGAIFGTVDEVHRWSSRVRIVTDTGWTAAGILLRQQLRGVVRGGGRDCVMSYVVTEETMAEGEPVVTSGTDGVFPPGLTIGTVTSCSWRKQKQAVDLRVKPVAKPALATTVIVLRRPADPEAPARPVRRSRRGRRSRRRR
jgi:rod shape-determining protein MreC